MWTQPSGKGCNFVKLLSFFFDFFQGKTFGGVRKSKKNVKVCNQPNHADCLSVGKAHEKGVHIYRVTLSCSTIDN